MNYLLLLSLSLIIICTGCSIKPVHKIKNVTYSETHGLQLDVYTPRKIKEPKKILVFVYGGNWIHGKKSIYKFFGKGMARKGMVCVVLNYRLSPKADINEMAGDVAKAVKWVKTNCASFHGDSSNIYISGHSAGGHLAAMVTTDNSYFEKLNITNPIKGTVLIDAFGLDMYKYLTVSQNPMDTMYKRTFTYEPANWKKYSPIYYLTKKTPAMLMFEGGKTYPVIKQLDNEFYDKLKTFQPNAQLIIVKGKSHVPMIFQFINPHVKAYRHILDFMQVSK